MTAIAPKAIDRLAPLQAAAVVAGAAVFLVASAALLNMLFSHAAIPNDLRKAAVVAHLASVMAALPLGLSQLVLPKGTVRHRLVGYTWLTLMVFTALVSFAIHTINKNGLSWIHLFSVLTLVLAPVIAWRARRGEVEKHRQAVLGLLGGGLVIAGAFTFIPGRVLGNLVMTMFGHG